MRHKIFKVVVGLGNHILPNTRHSIGMEVCDNLVQKYGGTAWSYTREYKAYISSFQFHNEEILLVKSKLPMNLNGKSVQKICNALDVKLKDIWVLHDDLDRSFGDVSWKFDGSARGHNGVKSVISCLSSNKFQRLRIGIGRPDDRKFVTDYVLSKFNPEETKTLESIIERSIHMIDKELLKIIELLPSENLAFAKPTTVENNSDGNKTT